MTQRLDTAVYHGPSLMTEQDVYLFKEGRHYRLYEKMGAHPARHEGQEGTIFSVWAPNAGAVSVIGDFNDWNAGAHQLAPRWDGSGIWEGFLPGVGKSAAYKYRIVNKESGFEVDKADPFAIHAQNAPSTASKVWDLDYQWEDGDWMHERGSRNGLSAPMSVYELHIGSWQRVPEEDNRQLSYTELAHRLTDYLLETGFTHVEFMPVMEHPFYGSWGYQGTGFFAASSRWGTPQELMFLVDWLHRHGIGVILDWVPSHFPTDEHGLIYFDGTHLYEHADPRQGIQQDWGSAIFNYGRNEVRSFLISSAHYWLDKYHADGLRVDAVASMLYLDYSREEGEWVPNKYGGNENLEAISFLREFNESVYKEFPDVQTMAEESTSWPMVSRPTYVGGLGFGLKWNMGWMHDTLAYMSQDPIHRKYHHNQLTFSIVYAFAENFILPLSHDEVVHGKYSLIGKMPGDEWQKLANLRCLYGYMWGHPGKKLLFMGCEFGQFQEWSHERSLDWHLLDLKQHQGLKRWVEDLNRLYRQDRAMHAMDSHPEGFQWLDCSDSESSVISFLRKDEDGDMTLFICNFTPMPRTNYRIGMPKAGVWREVLNSDAELYGGSGWGNLGAIHTRPVPCHGHYNSASLHLPPLGVLFLKPGEE